MNGSERDRAFFASRGFGARVGFGERPALIVVDFQRAFTDPSLPLGAECGDLIAATQRLVAAARAANVPIFYTAARFEEPNQRDAGVWGLKQNMSSLQAGSGTEVLDERLDVRPEDHVIWKKRASGFFGTDLLQRLTFERVDSTLICGVTSSGCVRATAIDAVSYGFRTSVVRETVGDRAQAPHEQALFDLEQKYCDVVQLDEALTHLEARASSSAFEPAT